MRKSALTTVFVSLAVCLLSAAAAARVLHIHEPQVEKGDQCKLTGILMDVNKAEGYLLVKGPNGDSKIYFDENTPIHQHVGGINKIDWDKGVISMGLLGAGQPAVAKIPDPAYLTAKYKDAGEFKKYWLNAKGAKKVRDFVISRDEVVPHAPTDDNPKVAGRLVGDTLVVGQEKFKIALDGHGRIRMAPGDLVPFSHLAMGFGEKLSPTEVRAKSIGVEDRTDPLKIEDPKLPRYLYIGDSISLNYGGPLRHALEGKVNILRPPTNCGRSIKGVKNLHAWMRAYDRPGRKWDVISFNFGHWDSGNSKEGYQQNLETIIEKLKKTKAKLIWVTTPPVPFGYNLRPDEFKQASPKDIPITEAKKLFHRVPGRMRVQNEWAAEVMARHPEIMICDHWQLVMNNFDGFYSQWCRGRNVHFRHGPEVPLGRSLARHVMRALGKDGDDINPPPEGQKEIPDPLSDEKPPGWKYPAKEKGTVPEK